MGASFNYVVVPGEIQAEEDLQQFYQDARAKLTEKHGSGNEGYTGDLASDDGELEVKPMLTLTLEDYKKPLHQESFANDYDADEKMQELIADHVEKWGPSIAIRVNGQWVICGFYSD